MRTVVTFCGERKEKIWSVHYHCAHKHDQHGKKLTRKEERKEQSERERLKRIKEKANRRDVEKECSVSVGTMLPEEALHDSQFASRRECLSWSILLLSILVVTFNGFAVCFWLANPERLDVDFADQCHLTMTEDNLTCDFFRVIAFLGTAMFLVLWMPIFFGNVMEHFGKKIEREAVEFKFFFKLLLLLPFALGSGAFALGIFFITASDEKWVFYMYAYISVVLGCVLGFLTLAFLAFYLGSFLVLEILLFAGFDEAQIRREYMYGGIPVAIDSPAGLRRRSVQLKQEERKLQAKEHELEQQEKRLKMEK